MGFEVADSVALVTGANRGIGKAIVECLAQHGAAKVYAAARDPQKTEQLVERFTDKVVPIRLDLADATTILAAARQAQDVQLVINNAATFSATSSLSPDMVANLTSEFDVNVIGAVRVAQAFAPVLKANGGGAFAQVNSIVSMKPVDQQAMYSLRESLADQRTQVLSVHPGPFATDMVVAAGFESMAEPTHVCAEEILSALASGVSHVFPGSLAKHFDRAQREYRERVLEPDIMDVIDRFTN